MTMRRDLLLLLILLVITNDVWTLSAPSGVSMDSVNLKHILRWSDLKDSCSTALLYSVQYQGGFELEFLNGSWVDAAKCQEIPSTCCDLTFDLGSDADYLLRVRAQCDSQLSNWTKVSFNRRDTILPAPEIMVTTTGDVLQVSIKKPSVSAMVTVWRKDDEQQAVVVMMREEEKEIHVDSLQEGAEYCVKAQVVLNPGVHSEHTDTHCVFITGPGAPAWKTPTTVTLTVIAMLSLLIGLFWSVTHCRSESCQAFFQKEPLPQSLGGKWKTSEWTQGEEVCEETPTLLSVSMEEKT